MLETFDNSFPLLSKQQQEKKKPNQLPQNRFFFSKEISRPQISLGNNVSNAVAGPNP